MANDEDDDLGASAKTQGSRIEIRAVIVLVVLLVVLGGVYVAVFGSPARKRAAIDNVNTDPYRAQNVQVRH